MSDSVAVPPANFFQPHHPPNNGQICVCQCHAYSHGTATTNLPPEIGVCTSENTINPAGPVKDTHEVTEDDGATHWSWRPYYLRKRVLIHFAVLLLLIITAIEALLGIIKKRNGLDLLSGDANQYYAWKYGPTAILTLLAAVFSRIEYQTKLVAPWRRLAGTHPGCPDCTLLLDYVSDFQPCAVFKALWYRDFAVSITSTVALIIKAMIVISTGLFTIHRVTGRHDNYPTTLVDRFVNSTALLEQNSTIPEAMMESLIKRSMNPPDGIFPTYAVPSLNISNLKDGVQTRVIVEGFQGSLDCEPADFDLLRMSTVSYDDPRIELHVTASSPSCNIQNTTLHTALFWTCGDPLQDHPGEWCNTLFGRFEPVICDGASTAERRRILVLTGNLTYSWDTVGNSSTSKSHPFNLHQTSQLLCTPSYHVTEVEVVRNATRVVSIDPVPSAEKRTFPWLSAWDVVRGHYGSFPFYTYPSRSSIKATFQFEPEVDIELDQAMLYVLGYSTENGMPPSVLFNQEFLEIAAISYFRLYSSILGKTSLMESATVPTTITITGPVDRLFMRIWVVHCMTGLAAVCVVLVVGACFLIPKHGILPCSPVTVSGMAALSAHSSDLLALLRNSGAASAKSLKHLFRGMRVNSATYTDPATGQHHFAIVPAWDQCNPPAEQHTSETPAINKRKHLWILHPMSRITWFLLLVTLAVVLEVTLRKSNTNQGLGDAPPPVSVEYTWIVLPAATFGALAMLFSAMDTEIRTLAPFVALKRSVTVKRLLSMDFMDKSIPRTLWHELRCGSVGALAGTTAFLIASVYTIFSASLFYVDVVPVVIPVEVKARRSFAIREEVSVDAERVAALIFRSNQSFYPPIWEDITFPNLYSQTPLPDDGGGNDASLWITAVVPALRSRLECHAHPMSEITVGQPKGGLLSGWSNTLGIRLNELDADDTREDNTSGNTTRWDFVFDVTHNMTYFGIARPKIGPRGLSLYAWGKLDSYDTEPKISHVAAASCNPNTELLSVEGTFVGTRFFFHPKYPPRPIEETARPLSITPGNNFSYQYLSTVGTGPDHLDKFFAMLTTSRWAVPLPSLGDPAAVSEVVAAIKKHHNIIQAQNLAASLTPADTTNALLTPEMLAENPTATDNMLVFPGNASTPPGYGQIRVMQDRTSTRILQSLLGVTAVLVLVSWAAMPETDVLPRKPTTIASVVALLAGGNLLESEARASGSVNGSEEESQTRGESEGNACRLYDSVWSKEAQKAVVQELQDAKVWMGWSEMPQGQGEGRVKRFGIFLLRGQEVSS